MLCCYVQFCDSCRSPGLAHLTISMFKLMARCLFFTRGLWKKKQTWRTTVNELRPLYRLWLCRWGIKMSAGCLSAAGKAKQSVINEKDTQHRNTAIIRVQCLSISSTTIPVKLFRNVTHSGLAHPACHWEYQRCKWSMLHIYDSLLKT